MFERTRKKDRERARLRHVFHKYPQSSVSLLPLQSSSSYVLDEKEKKRKTKKIQESVCLRLGIKIHLKDAYSQTNNAAVYCA